MQSCVYRGIICVDSDKSRTVTGANPPVYFVDDRYSNGEEVSHDNWCGERHKSADPFYYGSREWPFDTELMAPRGSCLNATWRTYASLFKDISTNSSRVLWLPDISLVNFDFMKNHHNLHLMMDTIWLLDVVLWQLSTTNTYGSTNAEIDELFEPSTYILFPNSVHDFQKQMSRDINRLVLALILRLRISRNSLPPSASDLLENSKFGKGNTPRLVFFQNEREKQHELICTRRFIAGAKLGDMGHPRVCEHIRRRSWALYDLPSPPLARAEYLWFEQPPKRVVLLDHHRTRMIRNKTHLIDALLEESVRSGFEFEHATTEELENVDDQVRFFNRVGVLITPHGGHGMGALWMPRYSVMVEIYPPAYWEGSVSSLVHACQIWHHQIRAAKTF